MCCTGEKRELTATRFLVRHTLSRVCYRSLSLWVMRRPHTAMSLQWVSSNAHISGRILNSFVFQVPFSTLELELNYFCLTTVLKRRNFSSAAEKRKSFHFTILDSTQSYINADLNLFRSFIYSGRRREGVKRETFSEKFLGGNSNFSLVSSREVSLVVVSKINNWRVIE